MPSANPPPTGVRRYRRGEQIGTGTFGTVYKGTDKTNNDTIVLKEVELRNLSAKDLKYSLAEVDVLKKLQHPNIVAYRDSFRIPSEQSLCIVMEYAAGGDLGSLIDDRKQSGGRFHEAEVLRILAQCADALNYCHTTCHLLHRDLKPANVFLTKKGEVKLGDFGISRTLTSTNALCRTQCGTPLFMSPEIAAGKQYDIAADVWALGCIVYNLTTLRQPWSDKINKRSGMMELYRLIQSTSLDISALKSQYSSEFCALLASMLAKQPSARPSCKQILNHPIIQRAASDSNSPPPPPRPPPPPAQARPTKPSNPAPPPPQQQPGPVAMAMATKAAFGSEAHVAAEALQKSFRHRIHNQHKKRPPPPGLQRKPAAAAQPQPPPPQPQSAAQPQSEYAQAMMAKINGLLGEARAINGAAFAPPVKKENSAQRERRELQEERMRKEEEMRKQREAYEELDRERAAQRNLIKAARQSPR